MTQSGSNHQLVDVLRGRVLLMGAWSRQALEEATCVMRTNDVTRANLILEGDTAIDALENEIDASALSLLVRLQPVARDLRMIMSAVRMVPDLERIGDECVTIAQQTVLNQEPLPACVVDDLVILGERARTMLDRAMDAFRRQDAPLALAVSQFNDETAQLMVRIMSTVVEEVSRQQVTPWTSMHVILITRALDRICRRTENIAEHTYFMIEGVSLKHRPRAEPVAFPVL